MSRKFDKKVQYCRLWWVRSSTHTLADLMTNVWITLKLLNGSLDKYSGCTLHFYKKKGSYTLNDNINAYTVTDREEDAVRIKVTDGMLSGYFRTARVCGDRRDYGDAQLLGGPKAAD